MTRRHIDTVALSPATLATINNVGEGLERGLTSIGSGLAHIGAGITAAANAYVYGHDKISERQRQRGQCSPSPYNDRRY